MGSDTGVSLGLGHLTWPHFPSPGPCSSSSYTASPTAAGSRRVSPLGALGWGWAEAGGVGGSWPTALCWHRGGGGGRHGGQGDELHHEADPVLLQHCQRHLQCHHRLRQLLQVGPSLLSYPWAGLGTHPRWLCQDPRAAACVGAIGDAVQHLGGLWYPEGGQRGTAGDREEQQCPHGLWVMTSPELLCVGPSPGSPSVPSPWAAPQHGHGEGGGAEDGDGDQGR